MALMRLPNLIEKGLVAGESPDMQMQNFNQHENNVGQFEIGHTEQGPARHECNDHNDLYRRKLSCPFQLLARRAVRRGPAGAPRRRGRRRGGPVQGRPGFF